MEAILSTNDINNYSVSELNYIRETIENMNKFNQIEVYRRRIINVVLIIIIQPIITISSHIF